MRFEDEIKQKHFEDERSKALINMIYTATKFQNMILDILKPYNMNEQHFNILRILRGRHPELACPGDIKDVLINKRGDLTRLLDKLVKMEYVHRNQNPENRRKIDVGITEKGLEFLTFMDDKFTYMKDLKDRFTEEEAKIMNEIFDKLRG